MTRAERVLWTVFGAGLSTCLVGVPRRYGDPLPYLVEAVLLVVAAALLALRVRREFRAETGAAKTLVVAALVVAAFIVGQLARVRSAFPFIPYTMYGRIQETTVAAYELRARHASGAERLFVPADELTTLRYGRISRGIEKRLLEAERSGLESTAGRQLVALVARTVSVLIGRYNGSHRDDPIECVRVVRLDVRPPYGSELVSRRVVETIGDADDCARGLP